MSNPVNRETMNASDVVRVMQEFIDIYGDRPVFFSDGYFRYGMNCHAESAANFDSPRCMLIKAFSLVTGRDGPNAPIDLAHD